MSKVCLISSNNDFNYLHTITIMIKSLGYDFTIYKNYIAFLNDYKLAPTSQWKVILIDKTMVMFSQDEIKARLANYNPTNTIKVAFIKDNIKIEELNEQLRE